MTDYDGLSSAELARLLLEKDESLAMAAGFVFRLSRVSLRGVALSSFRVWTATASRQSNDEGTNRRA
jgi:hypothetical protein